MQIASITEATNILSFAQGLPFCTTDVVLNFSTNKMQLQYENMYIFMVFHQQLELGYMGV